jgi:endonuclease YncB( thermonuclease family)
VKQGWCWWYRKYAPENMVLEGLEKEAQEDKKGLWADPPQPVLSWEWREKWAEAAGYRRSGRHQCNSFNFEL